MHSVTDGWNACIAMQGKHIDPVVFQGYLDACSDLDLMSPAPLFFRSRLYHSRATQLIDWAECKFLWELMRHPGNAHALMPAEPSVVAEVNMTVTENNLCRLWENMGSVDESKHVGLLESSVALLRIVKGSNDAAASEASARVVTSECTHVGTMLEALDCSDNVQLTARRRLG